MLDSIEETRINLLSEGTALEGKLVVRHSARIHGTVHGSIEAANGSMLILGETAMVEGEINGDSVWINGFVRGEVHGRTRVFISETGRVFGNIRTPSLQVAFGGFFDGQCLMEEEAAQPEHEPKEGPSLS